MLGSKERRKKDNKKEMNEEIWVPERGRYWEIRGKKDNNVNVGMLRWPQKLYCSQA